ncbi:MAG: hydroxymethylglutaryl-CoA synthase family protein [Acidimicrobiales bacterium]|nr:hydroxymethylglutaryl-CoA synthase family protein [Acidimicrobiales bacterium]
MAAGGSSGGIAAWGAYLPYWRLDRAAIGAAFRTASGRGTRAVASYDEDTTTLGVEAARRALAAGAPEPAELFFSTPDPAYLDKTNATTIGAALGLDSSLGAYDAGGSVRSAWGALRAAALAGREHPSLCVVSDLRTGLAGGAEESQAGDGAVAFVFGPEGGVAESIGRASRSDEFLDRWRVPGETASRQWEERFGEEALVPLARACFADALAEAGVTAEQVDHLVVTGLHARAVAAVRNRLGVPAERLVADDSSRIGNLGAAQSAWSLAAVLDGAEPGQVVAVLSVADGADAQVLRTTDELPRVQQERRAAGLASLETLAAAGRADLPYALFLSWRGQLRREPPRRPDPERPDAPAMRRNELWKFGFSASRCTVCGFVHLPPTRVCLSCRATDRMEPQRLADVRGTVATYTVDHLAFSPSPPLVGAVIDFDGGGRYRGEMTDVDPDAVAIGTRVEMTFRRFYSAQGVHNYFWKARPLPEDEAGEAAGSLQTGADRAAPERKENG